MLPEEGFAPLASKDLVWDLSQPLIYNENAPNTLMNQSLVARQCLAVRTIEVKPRVPEIPNGVMRAHDTFFKIDDELIPDELSLTFGSEKRLSHSSASGKDSQEYSKSTSQGTNKLKSCLKSSATDGKKPYQRVGILAPGESIPTATRLQDDEVTGEEVKTLPKVTVANKLPPRRVFNQTHEQEHRWRTWIHRIHEKCHKNISVDAWVRRVNEDPSDFSVISAQNHPNSTSSDGRISLSRKRPLKPLNI